jgi:hypothetical protein
MVPGQTARLAGSVVDSRGRPLGRGTLVLGPLVPSHGPAVAGRGSLRPDGSFTIDNVPPGSYVIQVRQAPTIPGVAVRDLEFGWLPVSVSGEPISDLAVVTSTGASLRGRIVVEDGVPPASGFQGFKPRTEAVESAMPAAPAVLPSGASTTVEADGTFEMRGLWGPRILSVDAPPGWMLKRVTVGGRDVTDVPIEFGTQQVTGVEIAVTSLVPSLSGTVADDRGRPAADFLVIVFAADRTRWTPGSRFVASGGPGWQHTSVIVVSESTLVKSTGEILIKSSVSPGAYRINGLPPADYLVVALPSTEGLAWAEPEVLEQLRALATAFRLTAGETRVLDLPLSDFRPR